MKKQFWIAALSLMLCVVLLIPVFADYPTQTDYLSDPSGVLSVTTVTALNEANQVLYEKKGVRIAVCITAGTGDETIAAFARNLFTAWDMCDGVLLVVDTTAPTYFGAQSVAIDKTLTNEALGNILSQSLEPDFSAGNTDNGILKTILQLQEFLTTNLPDLSAGGTETGGAETGGTTPKAADKTAEKQSSGFVGAILVILKVILWIVILAVVAVAALFIAALFNDDAAALFRRLILRRPANRPLPQYEYDDRLYGSGNRRQGQNGQGQNGAYRNHPSAPGGQRRPAGSSGYGSAARPQTQNGRQYQTQGQARRPNNGGYRDYRDER